MCYFIVKGLLWTYLLIDFIQLHFRLNLPRYLEQEVSEGNEGRSVLRFGAPALQHDVVDILRTVVWLTQPLGLHVHLVEDLRTDTKWTEYWRLIVSWGMINPKHEFLPPWSFIAKQKIPYKWCGCAYACTWLPLRPSHGSCPWVNISHRVTPNIQVSDAWEKVRDFRDSGAHLERDKDKDRQRECQRGRKTVESKTRTVWIIIRQQNFSGTRTLFSPRERDFVALLHDVLVGVCWQRPHQAKVSDLHRFVGGQKDVAGCEVPVEETLLLQVGHTARHLHTHRQIHSNTH